MKQGNEYPHASSKFPIKWKRVGLFRQPHMHMKTLKRFDLLKKCIDAEKLNLCMGVIILFCH